MSTNRSRSARSRRELGAHDGSPSVPRVVGKRAMLGTLAALGALGLPASAWATSVRLGTAGASPVTPSCPKLPCQALTRTTGFQAAVTGSHNAMVVGHAGRVVSWTITLSKPNADEVKYFNKLTGGPPEAALVTLRQGSNYRFRVVGATPTIAVTALFGMTKVFTLAQPLPVVKGEVIGLSIPTWAPVLAVGQADETAWRASRAHGNCNDVTTATFEIQPGALGQFECVYRNGRLAYGATITDTPTPASARGAQGTGRTGVRVARSSSAAPVAAAWPAALAVIAGVGVPAGLL